jgi:AraC-like DNA-binding protein
MAAIAGRVRHAPVAATSVVEDVAHADDRERAEAFRAALKPRSRRARGGLPDCRSGGAEGSRLRKVSSISEQPFEACSLCVSLTQFLPSTVLQMDQKTPAASFPDKLRHALALCDAQSGAGSEGGLFRIGVLSTAPEILTGLGADPVRVARDAGLDPGIFLDPDNTISFIELGRYLEKCVEHANCRHFGYLLGSKGSLEALGLMGRYMRQAPSLGAALEDISVHQVRYARGATVFFRKYEKEAHWGYFVYQQGMRAGDQLCTAATAAGIRILMELAPSCRYEVHLAQPPPPTIEEKARYEAGFGAKARFNAECHFLTIPVEELERPIAGAEPAERERLDQLIREYWLIAPPSFCHLVLRTLVSEVLIGQTSLPQIASQLAMHPRTLERRLEDEGTSFLILREAARYEIARQLLVGTRMKLAGISEAIGYAEPAVFSRTFRKWSGSAPKAFRVAHSERS